MGICKDETYARKLGPYVDYWEDIFELLSKPLLTQNSNCWKVFTLQAIGDLIMCPNPKLYLVWMERTKIEVVKDEQFTNFKHVHIQWCVPMKKGARNERNLYQNCWVN